MLGLDWAGWWSLLVQEVVAGLAYGECLLLMAADCFMTPACWLQAPPCADPGACPERYKPAIVLLLLPPAQVAKAQRAAAGEAEAERLAAELDAAREEAVQLESSVAELQSQVGLSSGPRSLALAWPSMGHIT